MPRRTNTMLVRDYVANDGVLCPVCGVDDSAHIGFTDTNGDGRMVQEATCNACGAEWYEHYKLTSYSMKVNEEENDV